MIRHIKYKYILQNIIFRGVYYMSISSKVSEIRKIMEDALCKLKNSCQEVVLIYSKLVKKAYKLLMSL